MRKEWCCCCCHCLSWMYSFNTCAAGVFNVLQFDYLLFSFQFVFPPIVLLHWQQQRVFACCRVSSSLLKTLAIPCTALRWICVHEIVMNVIGFKMWSEVGAAHIDWLNACARSKFNSLNVNTCARACVCIEIPIPVSHGKTSKMIPEKEETDKVRNDRKKIRTKKWSSRKTQTHTHARDTSQRGFKILSTKRIVCYCASDCVCVAFSSWFVGKSGAEVSHIRRTHALEHLRAYTVINVCQTNWNRQFLLSTKEAEEESGVEKKRQLQPNEAEMPKYPIRQSGVHISKWWKSYSALKKQN